MMNKIPWLSYRIGEQLFNVVLLSAQDVVDTILVPFKLFRFAL